MPPIVARPPYKKRDVPGEFQHGWWATELGNIQRAIPTSAQRRVKTLWVATANDRTLICDCTSAAVVIQLPAAEREQGLELIIKKIAGGFPVTILGVVDGVVDPTVVNVGDCITIQSDGIQWFATARIP